MNKISPQVFKTFASQLVTFSVLDNRLFMLHGEFISAQWPLDNIGIRLEKTPTRVKLAFMALESQSYQAFYLDLSEYTKVFDYFRLLGFLQSDILCQTDIKDNSNDENEIRQKSDY